MATVALKKWSKRAIPWAVIAFAGIVLAGSIAVYTRDDLLVMPAPPQTSAPSLEQLNYSIELAEEYLSGLYKSLDERSAVQSEYYAIPLRVFFREQNHWSLLGADASSSILPKDSSQTSEAYDISMENGAFTARIQLEWVASRQFRFSLAPSKVSEPLEVWLGPLKVGLYEPSAVRLLAATVLQSSDMSALASLRYTIRHATQQAYLFYDAKKDTRKAEKLLHFLWSNGYSPGFDARAVIFNRSLTLSEDLPVNRGAYQDCDHLPPGHTLAYAYQSKACQALGAYFTAGERDPLLQATYALQVLQKYQDPGREYNRSGAAQGWLQGGTPFATATHLRLQWGRTNVGIPSCTPLDCSDTASGIRTFVYGTLEAELGYGYGDQAAIHFADAAAATTVAVQIQNGTVHMSETTAYRPAQTGSFPVSWDKQGRFAPPEVSVASAAALMLIGQTAMPAEYVGISPSNSETTFDAWAFLVRYRCLKYRTGCLL